MPHILSDLHLEEVSLVEEPADQDAKVVLFKSADKKEVVGMADLSGAPEALQKALEDKDIEGLSQEALDAIASVIEQDSTEEESTPAETTEEVSTSEESTETEATASVEEETTEETPEVEETEAAPEAADEDVSKAVSELRKELETTQSELAKEREIRDIRDTVEKTRVRFPGFVDKAEELGLAMYRMNKNEMTDSDREVVGSLLDQLHSFAAESKLVQEQGTAIAGDDSPAGSIEKMAEAYKKDNPNASQSEAIRAVLDTPAGRQKYAETRATA